MPWGGPGQIAVDTFEFDPTLGVLEAGECYLEDCLSSKAVAMVRVANPVSGDVHNIAFSHLQAWYEPDQVAVREKQFAIAKDLFTSSLTPAELTSQPSLYPGDLNVPGENEVTAYGRLGVEQALQLVGQPQRQLLRLRRGAVHVQRLEPRWQPVH